MNEIIAAVMIHGWWRGSLNRADIAKLRLLGYRVVVLGEKDELFDVEVS